MKKYLVSILVISVLTFVLVSIFSLQQFNQRRMLKKTPVETFYFNDLLQSSISNECVEIINPLVYKGNDTVNKNYFFDLIRDKTLVFRFSGEACNTCIEFALEGLKKKFVDFATNDRILLIGSSINERIKEHYYGKPVISFYSSNLGIPIEEYNIPFMFIADKDRIVKMIFVPEKTMPELYELYLNTVYERYFSGSQ